MDLTLSWDLFIIFFFAVVIAYSFIIGKHQTLTILVATYIAVLATQGIGNLLQRLIGETQPVVQIFSILGVTINVSSLSLTKLILFMIAIICIALQGGVNVEYGNSHSSTINMIATGLFGFGTAGLIIMALLTFVAGMPILDPTLGQQPMILPLMQGSSLVKFMILNQDMWFALPALFLIGFGLVKERASS